MSIFSDLKPHAKNNKNVFDLSQNQTFSAKAGMLTPCFTLHTIPDSDYRIDVHSICRTQPMQTANFVTLSQNVEFFFVPYSLLWSHFNRFFYESGDVNRQNTTPALPLASVPDHNPTFNFSAVWTELATAYMAFRVYKVYEKKFAYSDDWAQLDQSLTMFLRSHGLLDEVTSNVYCNQPLHVDMLGRMCVVDQLRMFDNLGYGNYLPSFKAVADYCEFDQQDPWETNIGVQDTAEDMEGMVETAMNILKHDSPQSLSVATYYPNAWPILSYVKVFSDYYRNTIFDDKAYQMLFNIDWNDGTTRIPMEQIVACLRPMYHQYKKDMFTGVYPDAQFGNVAIAPFANPVTLTNANVGTTTASNVASVDNSAKRLGIRVSSGGNLISNTYDWNLSSGISALQIREAEALQRYKERILRAGNRMKSLQDAVFGDKSRFVADEYSELVGSFSSLINVNPVASTAETAVSGVSNKVGELGAYSVGNINGNEFQFHSHDFGVLIGMYYVMPESKYEAYGFDPQVIKSSPYDYYKPDFQNLGLAPVLSIFSNVATNAPQDVLGYLSRYYEYKTAVSKVHGLFFGSNPLIDETVMTGDMYPLSSTSGAFSQYVSCRKENAFINPTLRSLYIHPNCLDRLFYQSDDENMSSDQFLNEINFVVKAVLPMSVIGLPNY